MIPSHYTVNSPASQLISEEMSSQANEIHDYAAKNPEAASGWDSTKNHPSSIYHGVPGVTYTTDL